MQSDTTPSPSLEPMRQIPKIFVCTPVYGPPSTASITVPFHQKAMEMRGDPSIGARCELVNADLVRSRSRAAHFFLHYKFDWLLFWDADVIPRDVGIVGSMIATGADMIGLPYPHKDLDFEAIADGVRDEEEQARLGRQTGMELQAFGQTIPMCTSNPLQEMPLITWRGAAANDTTSEYALAEVDYLGFGFMLISRSCVIKMTEAYREELWYRDRIDGRRFDVVALFQLMFGPNRELLSEDYSFCERWRKLGGRVFCACDPATHIGGYQFKGNQNFIKRVA